MADAAYKTPHIRKKVFQDGRVLSTAYKRLRTRKGGHPWWAYVYDEYYDRVICPEYQNLSYRATNRDGYREYHSDPKICAQCPTRHLCTRSKNCVKTVPRHIWKDYEELADDARYTSEYKDIYAKRKETIERAFADAKEKHATRYTYYRGPTPVSNWARLKFAAMNPKKLARWKTRRLFLLPLSFSNIFFFKFRGLPGSFRVRPLFDKLRRERTFRPLSSSHRPLFLLSFLRQEHHNGSDHTKQREDMLPADTQIEKVSPPIPQSAEHQRDAEQNQGDSPQLIFHLFLLFRS